MQNRILAGRYRVEGLISKGGMGAVYRATQLHLERKVAIKVLMIQEGVDLEARCRREAAILASLDHPNIVTIHDFDECQGMWFIAMEHVEGRSLDVLLEEEETLGISRALRVGVQVCRALRQAHRQGIVHRDLKPANVMLTTEDDIELVKVLDFGLAKLFQQQPESSKSQVLTVGPTMVGSPKYMSPEQICSEPLDQRSDIYSFGALMFELICGVPPFEGSDHRTTITKHLNEPVPLMSERNPQVQCSEEIEALIRCCLEKRPEDRFESMDEVIAAIKSAYQQGAGISGRTPLPRGESERAVLLEGPVLAEVSAVPDFSARPEAAMRETSEPNMESLQIIARHPEVLPPAQTESSANRVLVGLCLIMAMFLGGAGAYLLFPQENPPTKTIIVKPEPNARMLERTEASVVFKSVPGGAQVLEGEVVLGVTPFIRTFPIEEPQRTRRFKFVMKGMQSVDVIAPVGRPRVMVQAELKPVQKDEQKTAALLRKRTGRRASMRKIAPKIVESKTVVPMLPPMSSGADPSVPMLDDDREAVPILVDESAKSVPMLEEAVPRLL